MGASQARAEIGVFGGSGFQKLLDEVELVQVATPFGDPSAEIAIGRVEGRSVAFMPRHGMRHRLPPHAINYRANLWAMHSLGVKQLIGPTAAGSLQPAIRPGDLVLCDQLVDRTWGRADTFYATGPEVVHISVADPYCPVMRRLASEAAGRGDGKVHQNGAVVVIQGPRFSTRAESRWFSQMGWHVVNMTQYPEVVLARELEMCYLNVSLVTDYDAGLEGDAAVSAVSVGEVERSFAANLALLRTLILDLVPRLPVERSCPCASALRGAVIGGP